MSDIFDKLDSMISSLVDVLEEVVAVEGGAAVRALVGLAAAALVEVDHVIKDAGLGDGGEVAVGTLLGFDGV